MKSKPREAVRIHVVGLPRSGTTSFARMLALRLGLPYIEEPIFIWSNRFRTDIGDRLSKSDLLGIREDVCRLSVICPRGYVEKTPHSIHLSEYFDELLDGAVVVLLVRKLSDINSSLNEKIFNNNDPNTTSNLWVHNLRIRIQKILTMFRMTGVCATCLSLLRSFSWLRKNSILNMDYPKIEEIMVDASNKLTLLTTRTDLSYDVLKVDYHDYKADNEMTVSIVADTIKKLRLSNHA